MSKSNYYSFRKLIKYKAQYVIAIGQRTNGKSYAVKKEVAFKNFMDRGEYHVYMRREQVDIKASAVEDYYADMPIKELTNGKFTCVRAYRDKIYLCNLDESGKKVDMTMFGYYVCLSGETHYKSRAFPNVSAIIYEEFITDSGYLYREIKAFNNLISTIVRDKKVPVYMIGNTIDQGCPYFRHWNIDIYSQKQGTTVIYDNATDDNKNVRIVVDYVKSDIQNSMFFGNDANMIVKGEWHADKYLHLEDFEDLEYYKTYQTTIFYHNDMKCYAMHLIRAKPNRPVLYVEDFDENKIEDKFRIIDRIHIVNDNVLQTRVYTEVTIYDELIKKLINEDRVIFNSDLTGQNFYSEKKKGAFI